jgi:hypothetical protein
MTTILQALVRHADVVLAVALVLALLSPFIQMAWMRISEKQR